MQTLMDMSSRYFYAVCRPCIRLARTCTRRLGTGESLDGRMTLAHIANESYSLMTGKTIRPNRMLRVS